MASSLDSVVGSHRGRDRHYLADRMRVESERDRSGTRWSVSAEGLVSETGERLSRVPAHRSFWFGWMAQYHRPPFISDHDDYEHVGRFTPFRARDACGSLGLRGYGVRPSTEPRNITHAAHHRI